MSQTNKLTLSLPIVSFKVRPKPFFKLFLFFISLIAFSLLLVSIYQLNAYITEIYSINLLEKEMAKITQENKILEIDTAKANSLSKIDNYLQEFEKVSNIKYVKTLEETTFGVLNYAHPEN